MTPSQTKSTKNAGGVEPISLDEMVDKCLTAIENEECRKYLENRKSYGFCFAYCDDNIPYFTMNSKTGNAARMYHYATITKLPKLDYSHLSNFENFCTGCVSLKEAVAAILKPSACSCMFDGCSSLKEVRLLNFDKITVANYQNYIFRNCKALVEVRFVATTIHWSISFADSPLLSTESVQSIIDGLATVTTAQTITFNKAVALSDEQKQIINEKGWTLVQ